MGSHFVSNFDFDFLLYFEIETIHLFKLLSFIATKFPLLVNFRTFTDQIKDLVSIWTHFSEEFAKRKTSLETILFNRNSVPRY